MQLSNIPTSNIPTALQKPANYFNTPLSILGSMLNAAAIRSVHKITNPDDDDVNKINAADDRKIEIEHSHFCFKLGSWKLACHFNENEVSFYKKKLANLAIEGEIIQTQNSGEIEIMDKKINHLKKYEYAFYTYQNSEGEVLGVIKLHLKDEINQRYLLIECSAGREQLALDENTVKSIINSYWEITDRISFA